MPVVDLAGVRDVAGTVLRARGLDLVDVELVGSGRARTLRLSVDVADAAAGEAVDLEALAAASEPVSAALDAADTVAGPYQLEVSSPGLERPLRHAQDFRRFVGTTITLKSHEAVDGARRHRGRLTAAGDAGVTVEVDGAPRMFGYDGIASARTVFEWGPAPKPSGPAKKGQQRGRVR
ncbi:MAG: ribosome maturation factor RimP [Acidimicrobiia bacterium]